jgi:hypothetical protein
MGDDKPGLIMDECMNWGESSQLDMEHFVRHNHHPFNPPFFSQKILAQLISSFNNILKFNILIHEAMRRSTRMM